MNAKGKVFKPLIILPNKKKLKELSEFEDFTNFATSISGWVTKDLFTVWVLCFVAELSLYRLTLPEEIREEPALLVVDGHSSRINFVAVYILLLFSVDLLILPPHHSHVLQPFDLSVGSPLKVAFIQELAKATLPQLEELENQEPHLQQKMTRKELRRQFVSSFLDALSKSATMSNVRSGFEKAGFVPFNQERPLESQYIPEILQLLKEQIIRNNSICSKLLNSGQSLYDLYLKEYKEAPPSNFEFDIKRVIEGLRNNTVRQGILLNKFPDIFEEIDCEISRFNFD
jgi:hypothetical protein